MRERLRRSFRPEVPRAFICGGAGAAGLGRRGTQLDRFEAPLERAEAMPHLTQEGEQGEEHEGFEHGASPL
jgi:hypothetical protein